MDAPQSITDVVPANFLCDNQTMQKIAQSQLLDEQALSSLEENLSILQSRQRCLKDELTTVERLISEAAAEQTRLRSSIATHKSLLAYSPVRPLPGEVLSEIFLHYIALSQSTDRDVFQEIVASHRIHTPILQVCRRWRTTALTDARLWTTIPLIGSSDEKKSFAHPLISGSPEERAAYWKALESRIERTSALPVQLLFHFTEYGDVGDPIYTISSLQTFIRLFPRANSISISISSSFHKLTPKLTSIMNNAAFSHAHLVHTARVNISNFSNKGFCQKILSAIPNVEVLQAGPAKWFIGALTPGHHLRSLQLLGDVPLAHLLDVLDRAPLLETLKLGHISITPSVGTLRVVTHTLLLTLHLAFVTREENDAFFGQLTLPALRSLSYVGAFYYNPQSWPRPSNLAFLQRSGCMLTELSFQECQVDEKLLAELLTVQKELVSLQLNAVANDDAKRPAAPIPTMILAFLSTQPKGASDRPLPALDFVSVVVLAHQLKAVKRLIESRSGNTAKKSRIATLREVAIQVNTKKRDADIKKDEYAAMFKAFVNNGIDVQISYKYQDKYC